MKKRFLSLLLSVVLIMGMLPVMSLTASAAATEYFADDFESYTVGDEWYGSDGDVMTVAGTAKWSMGKSLKTEIVSMEGYDGKTTKVMQVSNVIGNASSGSAYRLHPAISGTHSIDGIYVYEMKVTHPAENAYTRWQILPLRNDASYYGIVTDGNTIGRVLGGWQDIRVVVDTRDDSVIVYVNGELMSYKSSYTYTTDAFASYINMQYDKALGKSFYLDDFNWYYHPDATAATTKFPAENEENVSKAANPAVTFNTEIMDAVIGSDATLSAANVEIIKVENSAPVAVGSVALSADGKTVTATPEADLDYGTQYQVTFKDLTDIYGRAVANVSYSFTTMELPQLTFSDVVFKKEALATEGEVITELENGYISCEYSVTNNHASKTQDVLLFAVLWENDAIKSFQFFKKAALGSGETAGFYGGFNVTDAANSKIETYIWDSITTMLPLTEKGIFTTTGFVK